MARSVCFSRPVIKNAHNLASLGAVEGEGELHARAGHSVDDGGERAKLVNLLEDDHSRDEVREMLLQMILLLHPLLTLTHPIRLAHFARFAHHFIKNSHRFARRRRTHTPARWSGGT